MEKTKKANSIRKLLTLMLAFVMVFTGMGIGSWGVDTAWADDTRSTPITVLDDTGNCDVTLTSAIGYKLNVDTDEEITVEIPIYKTQVFKFTDSISISTNEPTPLLASASTTYPPTPPTPNTAAFDLPSLSTASLPSSNAVLINSSFKSTASFLH